MTLRTEDPEGYARQREFHRDRALTRKAGRKYRELKYVDMTREELLQEVQRQLNTVYAEAMDGRNHRLMAAAASAQTAFRELTSRGDQLQLPLE